MQSKESNIKLLLLGRAVSLFGNTIYLIVLPLYILNITQNLKFTGIFFAAVNLPTTIISIFIGTIIEKFNKKNIILISDFVTSILYFILFLYFKNSDSLIFLFLISLIFNFITIYRISEFKIWRTILVILYLFVSFYLLLFMMFMIGEG